MPNPPPLAYGMIYHIYNRGTNGEDLFVTPQAYAAFLKLYTRYIIPVAETYAYCLLRNHFHFIIRIRMPEEQRSSAVSRRKPSHELSPSRQFALLFGSYAQIINDRYDRTGSLFEHPFRRIPVESERYLYQLVIYIHRNPQHHGFVDDFRRWPFSSFKAIISDQRTRIERDTVLAWFEGRTRFMEAHIRDADLDDIRPLTIE
jgi:hypothetical protein